MKSSEHHNLLPFDGIAQYFGPVISGDDSKRYFEKLIAEILWKHDEVVVFGKKYVTKRKSAWYGENGEEYTYSKQTKKALPWTPELLELKSIAEKFSGAVFNSCLLNLYNDGAEGMSWHSDNEKELGPEPVIASMSFGAERVFKFRHKETKEQISVSLEDASLLVMRGTTQKHWHHALPKSLKIKGPRVNLTFRTIIK